MKLIWNLIKFVIFMAVLAFLLRQFAARWFAEIYLGRMLGTRVSVQGISVDPMNTQMKLEGLVIKNPLMFPEGNLAEITKIYVDWDLAKILERKIEFSTVDIVIAELRILNTPDHGLNIQALNIFKETRASLEFEIDRFVLTADRATYTDLTGERPLQKSFELNVDHVLYRHVRGLADAGKIIAWESLKRMGLKAFTGLFERSGSLPEAFGAGVGGVIESIREGREGAAS